MEVKVSNKGFNQNIVLVVLCNEYADIPKLAKPFSAGMHSHDLLSCILTLPMLWLLTSNAQECKKLRKSS